MTDVLARVLAVSVGLALVLATVSAVSLVLGTPDDRGYATRLVLQLLVLSGAWLLVNSPVEGRVLWVPAAGHGLTSADVLVLPPLAVAAVLVAVVALG